MKLKTLFLTLAISFCGLHLAAQVEQSAPAAEQKITYSKEELTKYAKVTNELEVIQNELEAELDKLLAEAGLEKAVFTKMTSAKMQGGDMSSFTEEQQAAFNEVQGVVMQKQQGVMMKLMEISKKHGLALGKFRAMTMDISADKSLAEKVKKIADSLKEQE